MWTSRFATNRCLRGWRRLVRGGAVAAGATVTQPSVPHPFLREAPLVEGRWIDPYAKGPLAEKRIAEVRLDGDDVATAEAWDVLSLFSCEALGSSGPVANLLIEPVVADEVARPDSPAVRAVQRAAKDRFGERVSGTAIVAVMRRLLTRAGGEARDAVGQAAARQPSEAAGEERADSRKRARSGSGSRIRLTDLVTARLLPPDAVLEANVHGVTHVARVRDGQIELDGR